MNISDNASIPTVESRVVSDSGGIPRGPVPAPSSPAGGRSPAHPSAPAVPGRTGRGRRPSRAWEAVPSYQPGQERIAVHPATTALRNAHDVWLACSDIHAAQQEHLIAFDLNIRHRVIARRVVAIGSVSGVDAHPREVFRQAIANGATAVILVHNHPSGDESPSAQDRDLTLRLRDVGILLGVPLLDHVVVSVAGYQSLVNSQVPGVK